MDRVDGGNNVGTCEFSALVTLNAQADHNDAHRDQFS
jgi:hypothetical protein